jgi:hypothetical protein
MKKGILLLGVLFAMVGCKSTPVQSVVQQAGCSVEQTVDTQVSNFIVSSLACANAAQVQTDVAALVAKTNICKASLPKPKAGKKASPLGPLLCPGIAGAVTSFVGAQIPASWQCTGGAVGTTLNAQVLAACEKNL